MKFFPVAVVASIRATAGFTFSHFDFASNGNTPVTKVVNLLTELKASIETDGKTEQQSYDKVACWCEATLVRKAKDISDAKTLIVDLSTTILKLEAETATHEAEVKNLEKAIAANEKSQADATEVRNKVNGEYNTEKTESEQAIGALEAATKAMTGAGEGKKGEFLSTGMQQAQLLSVAASMRPVLGRAEAAKIVSEQDLEAVRKFVTQPEDFMASRTASFGQVSQNPFGDYAPQSTQIQGILKGMYDAFSQSLEKANVEEADAEKAYRAFMATKKAEHKTLTATKQKHELDLAEKTKELADSNQLRDDTQAQLAADEDFFATTKQSCKDKATEWSTRSGLRTEELMGINKAVEILSSSAASAIFENATTTFVQVSKATVRVHKQMTSKDVAANLRALGLKHPKQAVAFQQLAAEVASAGHFDAVIASIDKMIQVLRKEEQDDIDHRDRCQGDQNKNKNDMEDLDHDIEKATSEISRMNDKATELGDAIKSLEAEIASTKADMEEALKIRNKEVKDFRQALKDDTEAVQLLDAAIVALNEFYKRNKLEAPAFAQKEEPEYTVDQDKMPETVWDGEGADYAGRKDTSTPVITLIAAIKEDLIKEMKVAREEEATTQKEYATQTAAMTDSLNAQIESKVATEKELAELKSKIQDTEEHKAGKETDLTEQGAEKDTLMSDCSWVETHFESRRDARKAETDGLIEAKGYLAGMETGEGI